MKTFITVLILSVIHAISAFAMEETVVLNYSYFQQVESNSLPDTTNKQELLKKVRERGWVRVIVIYNMEYDRSALANETQRQVLSQEIETMHSRLFDEINVRNLNVSGINKSRYPQMSLSANDEETVKKLYELSGVKNIREARFFWRN